MLPTSSFELVVILEVAAAVGCARSKAPPAEQPVDMRRALLAALVASRNPSSEQADMASPSLGPPTQTANPTVTSPKPGLGPDAPSGTPAVSATGPRPGSPPPALLEPSPAPTGAEARPATQDEAPPAVTAAALTEMPTTVSRTNATAERNESPAAAPESTPEETERAERARTRAEMKARAIAYLQTLASEYGAGSGFTGVGAGEGYTGIGAGNSGFTGVGAGEGYTGIGAGSGYTGIGAEEEDYTSPPMAPPGVLLVPVRPWLPYPLP